jgi:hypothetical protein
MKDGKISKIVLPILVAIISLVGVILVGQVMGYSELTELPEAERTSADGKIGMALMFTIIIVAIAGVAILGFFLYSLATNFKKSSKLLLGILGFAVVFAICYFAAGDAITPKMQEADGEITASTAKWIEAGLYLTVVLIGIAAAVWVVWGSVARRLK